MPRDMACGSWGIDCVHNLASLNMCDAQLLLLSILRAGSDVAAIEGKVYALDELLGQVECPHANPLLRVPKRYQCVASACCHVLSARRHSQRIARGCVCIERQGGLKGGIPHDLDAAVAARHEEVAAGPVEDALVRLDGLLVLGDDAERCAVYGGKKIVLDTVSLRCIDNAPLSHLPACNKLAAVGRPGEREGLLANLDLAHAGLGPDVPEADHTIRAAARKLALVDWMERDALELRGRNDARCAQLSRVLNVGLLWIPDAQCAVCRARCDEGARRVPGYGADVVRGRDSRARAQGVYVCGRLELGERGRELRLCKRSSAGRRRHALDVGRGG